MQNVCMHPIDGTDYLSIILLHPQNNWTKFIQLNVLVSVIRFREACSYVSSYLRGNTNEMSTYYLVNHMKDIHEVKGNQPPPFNHILCS